MIVSASYRTDIPAFYGPWFRARMAAGYCLAANPYGGAPATVSLRPEDVDGFVFWTRNAGAFLEDLAEVRRRGIPFILQTTVTGYPRALDASTIAADQAIAQFKEIAKRFGSAVPVWRYDPILVSSLTGMAWHEQNFARIAGELRGSTDEAVVSFTQYYAKTKANLRKAAAEPRVHLARSRRGGKARAAATAGGYRGGERHGADPLHPARSGGERHRRRALHRWPAAIANCRQRDRGEGEGQPAGLPLRGVAGYRRL